MGLAKYIARKSAYAVALLFVIIAFNFVLFQILPFVVSCPGASYTDCLTRIYLPEQPPRGVTNVTQWQHEFRDRIFRAYGFDQPIGIRFLLYYQNMLTLNFGYNNAGAGVGGLAGPVLYVIQTRVPFTILLLGGSAVTSFIAGIGLGVVASAKRGRLLDISSLASLLFVNALPVFFLGGMLQLIQLGSTGTAYMPVGLSTFGKSGWDYYTGELKSLFLPLVTLTIAGIGGVFLTQRAVMIDTLGEDYIIMARAKGVPERTVLYKHAFRNAILPIVTAFALSIGFILSGAIITETVFLWPGLGHATFQAVLGFNFPFAQAIFYLISIMVLVSLLIADIAYGFLDPRISRS